MNNWKRASIAFGVVALSLVVAGSGHAFVNHENQLTFSRPVALPGVVLPAGVYSFDLVDSNSLDLVIVRNHARTKLFYMGFTNLVQRPKGMSPNTPVVFGEARASDPRPIATWYEIGDTLGHQFLYR